MELRAAPAHLLARRLFAGRGASRALPFWADGGSSAAEVDGVFAPRRHFLAAFPSRVERLRVADLTRRGELIPWLRERLPAAGCAGEEDGPLTVVGLAYDAGRNLEELPATAAEEPRLPDVVVATYPAHLRSEGPRGPWTFVGRETEAGARLARALRAPPFRAARWNGAGKAGLASSMAPDAYEAVIRRVLAGIGAGEFYQVNVARRLECPFDAALAPELFARMRRSNPSAFGALWAMAPDLWLASSSPECLLAYDPDTREAHSYPIKGTRPRGGAPAEDRRLAAELLADAKEQAEHVMIVDLVRNDLGRVSVPGGVSVPTFKGLMTLPTVHHLVSDVAARVAPERDLADLIAALFPGGSITGAPKIAAMKEIEAVEGVRRGFYTGSVGVIEPNGRATFNILIRTCVLASGRLLYQTGGGIVADSSPNAEWAETEAKSAALVRVLTGRSDVVWREERRAN